jgi:excisionase family DNA binding protein
VNDEIHSRPMPHDAAIPPLVLTTQEVANLLSCSTCTVESKARAHKLPGVKYGTSWMFPREALLKVLNDQAMAQMVAPAPRKPKAIFVGTVRRARKRPDLSKWVPVEAPMDGNEDG